jgi:uncharacterized protein YgiM (DUF1202 family)
MMIILALLILACLPVSAISTPIAQPRKAITPTAQPEPAPTLETLTVTAEALNVRSGPATTNILRQLKRGDTVTVYEWQGDWARIGVNEWVHGDYLK